jgi:hypothetical protein
VLKCTFCARDKMASRQAEEKYRCQVQKRSSKMFALKQW